MKYAKLEFRDTALGWRWILRAPNGQIHAFSGEFYTRKRDAMRGYYRTMKAVYQGVRGA